MLGVGSRNRFVDGTIVVERHELYGGDAEPLKIGHAGGEFALAVHAGVRMGERQIGATMFFGDAAVLVVAEIADMGFPDHQVTAGDVRAAVLLPAVRIGLRQVHDHAAAPVHTGRAGPRIRRAIDGAVRETDEIVVVRAVADAVAVDLPGAGCAGGHFTGLEGLNGVIGRAGVEQAQGDAVGRGRPDTERGALGVGERAEIAILVDGIIRAWHG